MGQRFYLLFGTSNLIDLPSYVVFGQSIRAAIAISVQSSPFVMFDKKYTHLGNALEGRHQDRHEWSTGHKGEAGQPEANPVPGQVRLIGKGRPLV